MSWDWLQSDMQSVSEPSSHILEAYVLELQELELVEVEDQYINDRSNMSTL